MWTFWTRLCQGYGGQATRKPEISRHAGSSAPCPSCPPCPLPAKKNTQAVSPACGQVVRIQQGKAVLHAVPAALHIRLTTWPAIALAKAAETLLRNMKQLRFFAVNGPDRQTDMTDDQAEDRTDALDQTAFPHRIATSAVCPSGPVPSVICGDTPCYPAISGTDALTNSGKRCINTSTGSGPGPDGSGKNANHRKGR